MTTKTPFEKAIEYLRDCAKKEGKALDYESKTYKEVKEVITLALAEERQRIQKKLKNFMKKECYCTKIPFGQKIEEMAICQFCILSEDIEKVTE